MSMKLFDLSRWNLGKAVPFTRSATQESKDTKKTNSMDPPSDEEDSEADDDIMVEIGKKHDKKKTREANRKIAKSHWRAIILRRSFEIKVAMCILVFLVILLSSLLALYNNFGSDSHQSTTVTNYKKVKPTNDWYQTPTAPVSSPTSSNIGGTAGENADSSSSISLIEATLKDALGEDLLQDRLSSVGRAYRWITQEDDLHIVQTPTGIVQRFALAVFYFATGGLRTTSTWKYCSAVPTDVSNDHESFSSRCVMDEGDDTVLCASPDAFVECREYYEGDSTPLFPKRRWLSPVSECEWYGVTCNDDDVVERLEMPENGLMGRLPPQLEFLSGMKTIGLANNNLAGAVSIPGEWSLIENIDLSMNVMDIKFASTAGGSASHLNTLKLQGNTISSEFPPEIASFEKLVSLDLSDTELMGALPDSIDRLLLLTELNLESNFLSGAIPDSLWRMTSLEKLRLGSNSFSNAKLPAEIGDLVNLKELSLEGLNLGNEIPAELGDIEGLEVLELQNNLFQGDVPKEVCKLEELVEFQADCDGPDRILCDCCTHCCKKGKCKAV